MSLESSANNKRIAKNTLLLYGRMLLLMLISLYTSRVIINALGVEDYGIYNVVGGVVTMFSVLSGSLSSAISRFLTFELGTGDKEQLKKIFSSSLTIQAVIAIIIVILAETVGLWFLNEKMVIPENRMTAANWCFQFSVITFAIGLISVPYNAAIVAHERMSAFAYISILEATGKLVVAWLIVINPIDRLIFFAAMVAVIALVIRFTYNWYCKRHFEECTYHFVYDHGLLKQMFSFAGWNMFGSGSFVLRNQGVDILLNMFFGVTVNAAKGICNRVQNAVYQFVTNFQTAINPQLTIAIAQNDFGRNHELVIQGSKYSFYLLMFFSIPFLVETRSILCLWLGNVPDYTVEFVQWTFIYLQLDTLSRFMINSILAYGKIKNYQIIVGSTKLLVVPIVWILLLWGWQPVTAVVVNVFIEMICLAQRLYFNRRYTHLPVRVFMRDAFFNCWALFCLVWACVWIFDIYVCSHYLVVIPLSLMVTALLIWAIGLKQVERECILSKGKEFIKSKL